MRGCYFSLVSARRGEPKHFLYVCKVKQNPEVIPMKFPFFLNISSTIVILSVFLSACGSTASLAQSSLRRITSPEASADDIHALTNGNNAFALDLYQSLRSQD